MTTFEDIINNPALLSNIRDSRLILEVITNYPHYVTYVHMDYLTEELYKAFANNLYPLLHYIKDSKKNKKMCIDAVKYDIRSLEFVNNKYIKDVILYFRNNDLGKLFPIHCKNSVVYYPEHIDFIINQDRNKLMYLLENKVIWCSNYQYHPNPNMIFNIYYDWGIKYVNHDYELCLTAVNLNIYALCSINYKKNMKIFLRLLRKKIDYVCKIGITRFFQKRIEIAFLTIYYNRCKGNYAVFVLPKLLNRATRV